MSKYIIPPHKWKTRTCLFHITNIMAADGLATQGTMTLAAMILAQLNCDNLVPARWGYI